VSDLRRSAPRNSLGIRGCGGDPGSQGYQGRLERMVSVPQFSLWGGKRDSMLQLCAAGRSVSVRSRRPV